MIAAVTTARPVITRTAGFGQARTRASGSPSSGTTPTPSETTLKFQSPWKLSGPPKKNGTSHVTAARVGSDR